MNKFLKKPTTAPPLNMSGRFEKFNLTDNPFPSEPVVNKDSQDPRINGEIYESEIRRKELEQVVERFLKQSQATSNHLRLGYIIDTSFIGRGNGKSAFLVNLQQNINKNYCMDLSGGANKCFGLYVSPEPGGRTKTFPAFVDAIFASMIRANIIEECLATLMMGGVAELYPDALNDLATDEAELLAGLASKEWYVENNFSITEVKSLVFDNPFLQQLPSEFPLFKERQTLWPKLAQQQDFVDHYEQLKKGSERMDFVFSQLVRLFQAANFTGAYVLVDDFERVPDFQSARQKRDFALELRSSLFDGPYQSAKYGFFNFILVLHAGVQRLIADAWNDSGMENRAPISPKTSAKHVIPFEKLDQRHAELLLEKYLAAYRTNGEAPDSPLTPFTKGAVAKIGDWSEYNASKILKMAYDLLDKASTLSDQSVIDESFVVEARDAEEEDSSRVTLSLEQTPSTDLMKKVSSQDSNA